jgi:hypothetical protein
MTRAAQSRFTLGLNATGCLSRRRGTEMVGDVGDESVTFPVEVVDTAAGRVTCFPTPFYTVRTQRRG